MDEDPYYLSATFMIKINNFIILIAGMPKTSFLEVDIVFSEPEDLLKENIPNNIGKYCYLIDA